MAAAGTCRRVEQPGPARARRGPMALACAAALLATGTGVEAVPVSRRGLGAGRDSDPVFEQVFEYGVR